MASQPGDFTWSPPRDRWARTVDLPCSTLAELVDALTGEPTGTFVEIDGRRVTGLRFTGTPGYDRTVTLTTDPVR